MRCRSRKFMKTYSHFFRTTFSHSPLKNSEIDKIIIDNYRKPDNLSFHARRSTTIPNAGGDSVISEMYSIDNIQKSLNLIDCQCILEKEVRYWIDYKMVDYILKKDDISLGVSVTRAMPKIALNYVTASYLLNKKIRGLNLAKECVVDEHFFDEKILHIWCKNKYDANQLIKASKSIFWDGTLWISISNLDEIYRKTR